MNSSFPNRCSFSFLKFTKYVTNIIAEPKNKYGQQEQVTVRKHNRSTAFEWSVLKYWGWGGGLKPVLRVPNLALGFCHGSKHIVVRSAWRFSNSSMDHHGETNKSKINTMMKQRRGLDRNVLRPIPGVSNYPLKHWSKRKPTIEPRWAKQRTKKLRPQPTIKLISIFLYLQ